MALDLYIPAKAPSHRQKKVAQQLRELISEIILRGDLPPKYDDENNVLTLPRPVTITRVEVSPDLHHAMIFFVPLGGEEQESTLEYLHASTSFFRKMLGKKLSLRFTPNIRFVLDKGFEHTQRIDEIIEKLKP